MPVPAQTPRTEHTGNGVTTVFSFAYYAELDTDLAVYVDGDLIDPSLYSVSGLQQDNGGSVTFTTAPEDDAMVAIVRTTDLRRDTNYQTGGDFRAVEVVNPDFDRIWRALQDMAAGNIELSSVLRVPPGETINALPARADRLSKLIGLDSAGSLTVYNLADAPENYTATIAGAIERSLDDRLSERLSIIDYGASPSAAASVNTAAIQGLIDALPDTGGSIFVPDGEFNVNGGANGGIRLDGSSGDKSNVTIYGNGPASALIQAGVARDLTAPDDDTTQSPNVLKALSGSGFVVRNLRIEANKDSGGVAPTLADTWVGSTVYTYSAITPTYVQTQSNGTAIVTEASTDKVWRLLASHTSNATDIDVDVALSRWELVTDHSALNGWYYDESMNRGNALAFYGPLGGDPVEDVQIEGCTIVGGYNKAILIGSGPSKAGLKKAGVNNVRLKGNTVLDCVDGFGGLVATNVTISTNTITGTGDLIKSGADCDVHTISANILNGDATSGASTGVTSSESSNVTVSSNTINGARIGVFFSDNGLTTARGGSITGNTIKDCGQIGSVGTATAIVVSGSDHTTVSGNNIADPKNNGIKVTDSNDCTVTGNAVVGAEAWAFNFEDLIGITCSGNTASTTGFDGFYFEGVRHGSVSGNVSLDGNDADSATLYSGFRVGPYFSTDSTGLIFTGNTARDNRATKLQHYGLVIETGSTAIMALGNNFLGNDDGEVSNSGTNCPVGFNMAASTAGLRASSTVSADSDEGQSLGASSLRWANIYGTKIRAGNGTAFWTSGNGSPEGVVTGDIGCLYSRLDAPSAVTCLYVKTSGSGNTGWTAK